MLIVPVRSLESVQGGVWCLLGSEPRADAPRRWVPNECILNRAESDAGDMAVLVLDESRLPADLKADLGLS